MISGISFVGIRTGSLAEMRTFFTTVFALPVIHERDGFVAFRAPNGDRVELFDLSDTDHTHFDSGPVCGFEVADIAAARAALASVSGVTILSDIRGREGGTQWVHFRGPDGNVYEVVHHT